MTNKQSLWLMVVLLLAGFALRVIGLDAVPFRGDEAFTAQQWAMQPLSVTLAEEATRDPHPPLAYAMFRGWAQLLGVSEFSLRILPALLNLAGIAALYALGKRFDSRAVGLIAAFLWAIHPFEIWHAQDARNYAIWAGLSAIALWLALRALERQTRADWLLYVIAALLAVYTYYLEVFVLVTLNLYVLLAYWRKWSVWRQWALSQVVIGGIMALWYLQPRLLSGGGYGGTTGGFDALELLTWFLPVLNFGQVEMMRPAVGLMIAAVMLLSLLLLCRNQPRRALFAGLIALIPLILISLVSLRLSVFTPRYVLGTVPAYLLLVAYLVMRFPVRPVGGVLLIVWAGFSLVNLVQEAATPKAPNWPDVAQYLAERVTAEDVVIQTSVDAAFGFYYRQADVAAPDYGLPFTPQQPVDEIETFLSEQANRAESLWVAGQTFRDWPNYGVVEAWADANRQRVRDVTIAGLPVREYRPWQVAESEITPASLTTFAGQIELVEAYVFPPEPDNEITVWLYWRSLEQTETPLTAFVHLVGDVNPATGTPLWSQDDHPPQQGRVMTDAWALDAVYRDVYTLSLEGVRSGTYSLHVGWYNPQTDQRLLTDTAGDDSYVLDTVTLP
jgi:4-amino-4-deoxy-L-arabinose transferase-like glycosyltransferase